MFLRKMLGQLPDHAIDRLMDMLHQFEEEGSWPQELLQWKLVFLPKVATSGKIPLGNQLRPNFDWAGHIPCLECGEASTYPWFSESISFA